MGKTWFEGFWHQGTLLNFTWPLWISCTHSRCCWHRLLKPTQDTLGGGQALPGNPGEKRLRFGHSGTLAGCGTHKDFIPGNMLNGTSVLRPKPRLSFSLKTSVLFFSCIHIVFPSLLLPWFATLIYALTTSKAAGAKFQNIHFFSTYLVPTMDKTLL